MHFTVHYNAVALHVCKCLYKGNVCNIVCTALHVWNVSTRYCEHTLHGAHKHQSAVTSLQFTENFVVTSSDDGSVKVWDIKTDFIRDLIVLDSGGNGIYNQHCMSNCTIQCKLVLSTYLYTVHIYNNYACMVLSFLMIYSLHCMLILSPVSCFSGGVVWRVKCNDRKLVCAVGSRNGIEDTKLFVLDFDCHPD